MTIPQLRMLKLFREREFTIDQALRLDQRTFGCLCHHIWVDWNTAHNTFEITALGEVVFERSNVVHNFRKYNNGRFSVRVPKLRKSLHAVKMSKRSAA